MNQLQINNTPFSTINYSPKRESERALNYIKSQRESKYPDDPNTLSAHVTFGPISDIKRPKNTTEDFYKQHPELNHLPNYINKSKE